ncbi:hypothetical protein LEP1GSC021_4483 [Leptospira noguchii str. 1993005606]|nr:hypothetical protein LEP1GSC021_4483 [Leptospira noguchii str. 1993005606]
MFPVCNLLTRAESPAGCLWQAGFAPIFLRRTHVNYSWDRKDPEDGTFLTQIWFERNRAVLLEK